MKKRVKDAVSFIGKFEAAIVKYAEKFSVNAVLCGHIHSAAIHQFGAITYYNCGDWVETCSALIEREDGALEMVNRHPSLAAAFARIRYRWRRFHPMKQRRHKRSEVTPATMLERELESLRRDLRSTIRAYVARLEIDLAESTQAVGSVKNGENMSRERLHDIRELMILVRNRKLKPQNGRRKDVRKIDSLIRDVHSITHPNASR